MNLRRSLLAAALSVAGTFVAPLAAQAYPTKPITVVVPFSAGGPTDTVARQLVEAMRPHLGQNIIVENVGGAGGTVGTARVARADPDGYTVLLMHIGFSTAPSLYNNPGFQYDQDFEPIGMIVDVPMTMVARSDFAPSDFPAFLEHVKANANTLTMANAGIGSASHLCGLMFMSATGLDITTIPYRGTGPAITDLIGRQVDLMCDQTTNTSSHIRAGSIKAYAVTSSERVATLPDLPTMAESGIDGFQVGIWHGFWAPKGTPAPVIEALNKALQAGVQDPNFVNRMNELGAQVVSLDRVTPEALRSHVNEQVAKWGQVIQAAGIQKQ